MKILLSICIHIYKPIIAVLVYVQHFAVSSPKIVFNLHWRTRDGRLGTFHVRIKAPPAISTIHVLQDGQEGGNEGYVWMCYAPLNNVVWLQLRGTKTEVMLARRCWCGCATYKMYVKCHLHEAVGFFHAATGATQNCLWWPRVVYIS